MSSFCKCKGYSHFLNKNICLYAIFNNQSFNETLTNDIVSYEQWALITGQTYIHQSHHHQKLFYWTKYLVNSFIATGNKKRLLQTAWIQMRRLITSRLIWIYAVWYSVFQLYVYTSFQSIVCLKNKKKLQTPNVVWNMAPKDLKAAPLLQFFFVFASVAFNVTSI